MDLFKKKEKNKDQKDLPSLTSSSNSTSPTKESTFNRLRSLSANLFSGKKPNQTSPQKTEPAPAPDSPPSPKKQSQFIRNLPKLQRRVTSFLPVAEDFERTENLFERMTSHKKIHSLVMAANEPELTLLAEFLTSPELPVLMDQVNKSLKDSETCFQIRNSIIEVAKAHRIVIGHANCLLSFRFLLNFHPALQNEEKNMIANLAELTDSLSSRPNKPLKEFANMSEIWTKSIRSGFPSQSQNLQKETEGLEILSRFSKFDFDELEERTTAVSKSKKELTASLLRTDEFLVKRTSKTRSAKSGSIDKSEKTASNLTEENAHLYTQLKKALKELMDILILHQQQLNIVMLSYLCSQMQARSQLHLDALNLLQKLEPSIKQTESALQQVYIDSPFQPLKFGELIYFRKQTHQMAYVVLRPNSLIIYANKKIELSLLLTTCRIYIPEEKQTKEEARFELISTESKFRGHPFLLGASSVQQRDQWIHAIQERIQLLINQQSTQVLRTGSQNLSSDQLKKLYSVPGNNSCADCGFKDPEWASINLGVLLCLECSGVHRSLGVHVSKVRSVRLDEWDLNVFEFMLNTGNECVNRLYETGIFLKPNPMSPREQRQSFIMAKYVDKRFMNNQVAIPSEQKPVVTFLDDQKPLKKKPPPLPPKNSASRSLSLRNVRVLKEGYIVSMPHRPTEKSSRNKLISSNCPMPKSETFVDSPQSSPTQLFVEEIKDQIPEKLENI